MSNKKVDYKELSNKVCARRGCTKRIKKNVINRQPDAKYCYEHYIELKRTKQNSHGKPTIK